MAEVFQRRERQSRPLFAVCVTSYWDFPPTSKTEEPQD